MTGKAHREAEENTAAGQKETQARGGGSAEIGIGKGKGTEIRKQVGEIIMKGGKLNNQNLNKYGLFNS